MTQRQFVSLGMFIVDEFLFEDEDGNPTGRNLDPQVSLCRRSGDNPPRNPSACSLLIFPSGFGVDVDWRWRNLCCHRS
jgi:hypothetical protein